MDALALLRPVGIAAVLVWPAVAGAGSPYPDAAQPWAAAEYVNFYFGHYNGNQALPHLRQPGPRAVFERLIDRGNVDRVAAGPLADQEKLTQLSIIISATGAARGAYNIALIAGEPLAEELTQLQLFTLHAVSSAQRLAKGAPGWPLPTGAWKTTVLGVAQSLSERTAYSAAQRALLADGLIAALPGLGPMLSQDEVLQLANMLAALNRSENQSRVREVQERLLRDVLALVI